MNISDGSLSETEFPLHANMETGCKTNAKQLGYRLDACGRKRKSSISIRSYTLFIIGDEQTIVFQLIV